MISSLLPIEKLYEMLYNIQEINDGENIIFFPYLKN